MASFMFLPVLDYFSEISYMCVCVCLLVRLGRFQVALTVHSNVIGH